MIAWLHFGLLLLLTAIVGYQLAIVLLGGLRTPRKVPDHGPETRFAILVPAHNEELLVERTLKSLRETDYPSSLRDIVVIADNCTDNTAEVAWRAGAITLVRTDEELRGKGYALAWAFRRLPAYDAYVIVDADTVASANLLRALNGLLREGAQAVQVVDGTAAPEESWLGELSVLSDSVQFYIYYAARQRLGLSIKLHGNGMCLSRHVVETVGWQAFSVTENWEYYLQLLRKGVMARYTAEAAVCAQQVATLRDGQTQRLRWMTGKRRLISHYVPGLLAAALRRGDALALDAVIDFLLPSYSMQLLMLLSAAALGLLTDAYVLWSLGLVVVFAAYSGLAFKYVNLRRLLYNSPRIPVYLSWKLWLKLLSLIQPQRLQWIRTRRHAAK